MRINNLVVFLRTLSTKQKYIISARILKYMYNQNTYMLPLFFYLRTLLRILKH